jgi:Glu-tRNA(Gln) amidotransferase subunit E-like FAD-binding protein
MNLKYLLSAVVVVVAVVCALFAWYKKCPPPPPPKKQEEEVVEEEEEKPEPKLNEVETRLYQYLETESKEKTIGMVETVKDLFNINEVPLNTDSINDDVVGFVRTVREWDRSVRKLEQKDAESMYNTINSLNVDSELFDVVINDHVKTCGGGNKSTILFKRILKQLTDEAIKGELFKVLFLSEDIKGYAY